ncbi:H-NS histone family protein (plasmid) [Pseudomonas parakoreensis]
MRRQRCRQEQISGEIEIRAHDTRTGIRSIGRRPPRGQARYRDPGNPFHTWSGRGKRPAWLKEYLDAGRQLAEFEIQEKED